MISKPFFPSLFTFILYVVQDTNSRKCEIILSKSNESANNYNSLSDNSLADISLDISISVSPYSSTKGVSEHDTS